MSVAYQASPLQFLRSIPWLQLANSKRLWNALPMPLQDTAGYCKVLRYLLLQSSAQCYSMLLSLACSVCLHGAEPHCQMAVLLTSLPPHLFLCTQLGPFTHALGWRPGACSVQSYRLLGTLVPKWEFYLKSSRHFCVIRSIFLAWCPLFFIR